MAESVKPREPTVAVIPGARVESATYVLDGEDHTLGNALRYAIMRDAGVVFCGYSVPHPSEERLNLRVQVRPGDGRTAEAAFRRGLDSLGAAAATLSGSFSAALAARDGAAGAAAAAADGDGGGDGAAAAAADDGGGGGGGGDEEMAGGAAAADAGRRKQSRSKR